MNMLEFLKEIENLKEQLSDEAQLFLYSSIENFNANAITEKGILILKSMQDNNEKYNNIFSAKQISELVFTLSARSVSGSMKKLVADGFVEKIGINPISYRLTEKGSRYQFDK